MAKKSRNASAFFEGSPEKRKNVSLLRTQQEPLYEQLLRATQESGAGGAFGQAADYYRNLLGNNEEDYQAFAAPALRDYYENIVPNLSEQFAGMGAGALSSSGFRNAQIQGGIDLAERLAQIRANLRHQGAQGLQNIGQLGLGGYSQNMMTQQGSPGFLSNVAPAVGKAIPYIAEGLANKYGSPTQNSTNTPPNVNPSSTGNKTGFNSGPYQSSSSSMRSSPNIETSGGNFKLPNFLETGGGRGY